MSSTTSIGIIDLLRNLMRNNVHKRSPSSDNNAHRNVNYTGTQVTFIPLITQYPPCSRILVITIKTKSSTLNNYQCIMSLDN